MSTKSLLCRVPVRKPKGRRWCVWRNTSLLVVFDTHATFIRRSRIRTGTRFREAKKSNEPPAARNESAPPSFFIFHSSFFIATLRVATFSFQIKISPRFRPLLLLGGLRRDCMIPKRESSLHNHSTANHCRNRDAQSDGFSAFA